MKVLFVSNDKAIFESGTSVRKRMQEYASVIGTLHIIGRAKKRVEETDGALVLHGYPWPALIALALFPSVIRKLVTMQNVEIVSAQDPFEYGWVALCGLRDTTAKLHVQIHTDFLSPWFVRGSLATALINRIRLWLADRVLMHAKGIRVVSERIRASLIAHYASSIPTPHVLPIPPSDVLPQKLPLPPHSYTFVLLAVCRLEEEKRVEDLFHALFRVERHYPNTGLMIIGDGRDRKKLEEKAKSCCRPNSVQFLGWRTDALSFMQSANAFVQASAYEGYGRTLVEAALARVPIVTSTVGVVGELFVPGEDVLSFPPGDVGALTSALEQIIEDERLRIMLPMQALHKAKTHIASFTDQPRRIAEDLAQVLKKA